ncbi:hypothetical protein CPB86DRAFT_791314 [Serendipita vermifera]|nr:hypothetical protein CPB86DRAFT_791314 [Serendipita vermifera]
MASLAGIALSRLTYDAEFSITRVDGYPIGPITFYPPTIHTLPEAHTIKEMTDAFERVIDFDLGHRKNGYAITYPIASNTAQRSGIVVANMYSHDHFYVWANRIARKEFMGRKYEPNSDFLFVDLTPGQIAAKFGHTVMGMRYWTHGFSETKSLILSEEQQQGLEGWTAQDVYAKLVKPFLSSTTKKLDLVGILLPEGALSNFSSSEIEKALSGIDVRWVHLNDLSYGAAVTMNEDLFNDSDDSDEEEYPCVPIGITLANGKTVTIVTYCPVNRKVLFTNSQDNQTTATVKILVGTTPFNKLTLEGLTPKPKGQTRIKVTLAFTKYGFAKMTVEEVGTDKKVHRDLGRILNWGVDTRKDTTNEQVDMIVGMDGVIGELPV